MSEYQLLTAALRQQLLANGRAPDKDHAPVLKLFNPAGAATWLATEFDPDGDILFGLADLGMGCPELGSFGLAELEGLRLPFGLRIERDLHFSTDQPVSVWADTARSTGSIIAAERRLAARRG